jgi:gluconokinase
MKRITSIPPVVIIGVCGSGKSALGGMLAEALNCAFVEADSFHSDENRAKMARGEALTDSERDPWLDAVGKASVSSSNVRGGPVIACSALKGAYRDRLRGYLPEAFFIHLSGDRSLLVDRLLNRKAHFVGVALLDSQLAILEPLDENESGMIIDSSQPLPKVMQQILDHFDAADNVGFASKDSRNTAVGD